MRVSLRSVFAATLAQRGAGRAVQRAKSSDDYLRMAVQTDTHSPGQYRVNGLMRNIDGWYDAFGIKPGDALYLAPQDRVRIW